MSGLIYWQMISENSIQYVSQKLYRFFICSYRFKHLNYEKNKQSQICRKVILTDRQTHRHTDRQTGYGNKNIQTDRHKESLTPREIGM